MKTISKILFGFVAMATLVGCQDFLDTQPQGATVTSEQKANLYKSNPELFATDINAMYGQMYGSVTPAGIGGHAAYGMPAYQLHMDMGAADITGDNSGYDWFNVAASYRDRLPTSDYALFYWNVLYRQIYSCNNVLLSIDPNTQDKAIQQYMGQALALRAYNYFHLAQMYQFRYADNLNKPCVPLVLHDTPTEQIAANPRATVQEVYAQIDSDIDKAIQLLEGYKAPSKAWVGEAAAYGIRARIHLVQQKWEEAAADADKCLQISGATPYTIAQVSVPAFNDAAASTVIWANIVTETASVVTSGIVNWPSHLCSFGSNGYTTVGPVRRINELLYDQIPPTDVRKGWWLDENVESPLVAGSKYTEWFAAMSAYLQKCVNVKWGGYKDDPRSSVAAQPWILMRAEEMHLIKAEATAMAGNAASGKALLENFIKTYRNPSYTLAATSATAIQDEVFFQRRIELWGEGFAFFDHMRLEKDIIRVDVANNKKSNFPKEFRFNIPAKNGYLLLRIPESEINANAGISQEQNNTEGSVPTLIN